MRVNAGGVDAVAQACADQPDRPVLVLVSSLAAAGPSAERPTIESDPPAPVSDYGRSKLAGEQVAMRYADALPITVVRPCVVFGAGDRGMYEVFKPIARSGLHVVGGSGDRRVSLVAVADLVECLVLAAEQGERLVPGPRDRASTSPPRRTFRTSSSAWRSRARSGSRRPALSVCRNGRCGRSAGSAIVMSRIRRRPGWVGRDKIREILAGSWTCSSAKARQQLGWSPAAPLADRLRETAQWYRDAHWL